MGREGESGLPGVDGLAVGFAHTCLGITQKEDMWSLKNLYLT